MDAVMLVMVEKRNTDAPALQRILTDYGCFIRTRLGLHEAGATCSDHGLIILQVTGNGDQIRSLEAEINKLDDVMAKTIDIPF